MELTFEHSASVGSGSNPSIVHLSEGKVYILFVSDNRLIAKSWQPNSGDVDWDSPLFGASTFGTKDKNLSNVKLKRLSKEGVYGAWHQSQVIDESDERFRVAVWDMGTDISKYLKNGSIRLDGDALVGSASLTYKNPNQILSGETKSKILPGNKISLYFTMGDSEEYPFGVFYVDRIEFDVAEENINLSLRNMSGKFLKDQTFDEDYQYPIDVYAYVLADMLDNAGLTNYVIQQPDDPLTAWQCGAEYPPDMTFLDGITDFINWADNWKAIETLDGQLIIGSTLTFAHFINLFGSYSFNRGNELISRSISRDDEDVYTRVCYQSRNTTTEETIRAYAPVAHALEWVTYPHKTIYVTVADNTVLADLEAKAIELADRLAYAGVIETFTGLFRPHIIPGDEATITEQDSTLRLAGLITTVQHTFGDNGFKTAFTVDSSGRKGKTQLKDLIQPKTTSDSSIKRLY